MSAARDQRRAQALFDLSAWAAENGNAWALNWACHTRAALGRSARLAAAAKAQETDVVAALGVPFAADPFGDLEKHARQPCVDPVPLDQFIDRRLALSTAGGADVTQLRHARGAQIAQSDAAFLNHICSYFVRIARGNRKARGA